MLNFIDFISPPITLYHLERRTHTSKIGGSLVLIMLTIILLYISFLVYNLIWHKNITSIFHKQFQVEPGNYSFNSSSLFHFIKLFSPDNGGYFDKYNSKYIRIYTTYSYSNFSYNDSDLVFYDHWVYDSCQNNIDNKDIDPSLFPHYVNFTNAACIRFYYNSTEKKYYHLNDKNFFWPYLENGLSQINNLYLTTIVQKCTNSSSNKILGECSPQKEIDEYLSKYTSTFLFFTDIRIVPTNYENPIQKYLNMISIGINKKYTFVENYIHYAPLILRTKEGNIFGSTKDINTFYFDFNSEASKDNNNNFTIVKFYHIMNNNIQIYERIYKNAFDLLSEIGGVIQIIFYIFFWINYIYNKYIVAYDTYSLFFFVQDEDLNHKKGLRNIFFDFKLNSNNYKQPKKLSVEIKGHKNNFIYFNTNKIIDKNLNKNESKKNIKINTDYVIKKTYEKTTKDIIVKNIYGYKKKKLNMDENCSCEKLNINNNNFLINKFKKENKEKEIENENILNKRINNNRRSILGKYSSKSNKSVLSNRSHINSIVLSKQSIGKIEHNNIKFRLIMDKDNRKSVMRFAFIDSVKSCCFKKNKGSHNFLITFRKHLLSEEHLFKNHIKIVLLEKHHNLNLEENTNILESYNEL